MPLYVYRIVRLATGSPDDVPPETFEVVQSIHDPALTRHPETGEPVERVILSPNIGRGSAGPAQLSSAGFTQYKKTSDGTYEKTAGGGPKHINPREA